MLTSLIIKFLGVFVVKSRSSNAELITSNERWQDHLQWYGGRYLNQTELIAYQDKFLSSETTNHL